MISLPELERALEEASHTFVPEGVEARAREILAEALSDKTKAEEATHWMRTAWRAAVNAMTTAAEEPDKAYQSLTVAAKSLASALEATAGQGVNEADVRSAKQLLVAMTGMQARAAERLPPKTTEVRQDLLAPHAEDEDVEA